MFELNRSIKSTWAIFGLCQAICGHHHAGNSTLIKRTTKNNTIKM